MAIDYAPTKNDVKYFTWCCKNAIRIYPKPIERGMNNKLYYICIEINEKEHCDNNRTYEKNEITGILYEYYKYYYDKYNKQV